MRMNAMRLFSSTLLAVFMMGCGSSAPVFEPSISVTVNMQAADDINRFEDDIPRPLIIRLYQLKESGAFENAEFVSIYESDTSVLASSLIDSKVMPPVIPGETRSFTLEVQQETKFIAVFAEFADYEVATSKAVVALVEEPDENPIIIRISQAKIQISQPVDSSWW